MSSLLGNQFDNIWNTQYLPQTKQISDLIENLKVNTTINNDLLTSIDTNLNTNLNEIDDLINNVNKNLAELKVVIDQFNSSYTSQKNALEAKISELDLQLKQSKEYIAQQAEGGLTYEQKSINDIKQQYLAKLNQIKLAHDAFNLALTQLSSILKAQQDAFDQAINGSSEKLNSRLSIIRDNLNKLNDSINKVTQLLQPVVQQGGRKYKIKKSRRRKTGGKKSKKSHKRSHHKYRK